MQGIDRAVIVRCSDEECSETQKLDFLRSRQLSVIQRNCIIEVFKLLCGYKKKGVGYKLEDLIHDFQVLREDEPFGLRRKAKLYTI